jgi:hypothetical protein
MLILLFLLICCGALAVTNVIIFVPESILYAPPLPFAISAVILIGLFSWLIGE